MCTAFETSWVIIAHNTIDVALTVNVDWEIVLIHIAVVWIIRTKR